MSRTGSLLILGRFCAGSRRSAARGRAPPVTIVAAERGERGALWEAPPEPDGSPGRTRYRRRPASTLGGVGSIVLLIGVAVVCVGIGAAAAFAFAPPVYASRSNGITAGSTLEDDGVVPVLAALRSTVVVLDDDDEVLRASANAYTYNIVRDDQVCEPHVAEMVARVRAGGAPEETELTVARGRVAGAGQFYLYVRVAAIGGGRILVLIEDRTAAKRLEDMRRDFVANVSHELKTPVGAIALLAETVEGAVDDPDLVRNYVGRIRRETTRLGVLVQEIMELSRLQEGDALVEPDDVDLDAVVAEAIDRVRTEAGCFAITLEKVPADLAAEVTKRVSCATIGIGAGNATDGQILVYADMLGLTQGFKPKFLRQYANLGQQMNDAVQAYIADVKATAFLSVDESY